MASGLHVPAGGVPTSARPRSPQRHNTSLDGTEAEEITDPKRIKIDPQPFAYGHYADVYVGWYKPPGSDEWLKVAIKVLRLAGQNTGKTQEFQDSLKKINKRLGKEMYVWQTLDHPRITKLVGYMKTSNKIIGGGDRACLVTVYRGRGDLKVHLGRHPEADRMAILLQAADGLNYLHTHKPKAIAHLDIKPANILVDDQGGVELCDFGISKMLDDVSTGFTTSGNQGKGTMPYMSPEVLDGDGGSGTTASDVYAFGALIVETLSGQPPFYQIRAKGQVVMQLSQGKTAQRKDHPIPSLSEEAQDRLWILLTRCWSLKPEDRPLMSEVIEELKGIQDTTSPQGND